MDTLLQEIRDETFPAGTVVEIDGKRFVGCTFDRCRLVYRGEDELSFEGCTFIDPTWSFEDSAQNVLAFMGDLYGGLGDEGQLIESLFQAVRRGQVRDTDIPIVPAHDLSRLRMAG